MINCNKKLLLKLRNELEKKNSEVEEKLKKILEENIKLNDLV